MASRLVLLVSLLGFCSVVLSRFTTPYEKMSPKLGPNTTDSKAFNIFSDTVMIPMRDEVELFAIILSNTPLDQIETGLPTVMIRTPYSARLEAPQYGTQFVIEGYIALIQDMRGRFNSEGNWSIFRKSADDGSDTIDWITQQSWSSGQVLAFGVSADGIAATTLEIPVPPPSNLLAQHLIVSTGDSYPATYQDGLYRESLSSGWLTEIGESSSIQEVLDNEMYSSWWYPTDLSREYGNTHIPAVHWGGWYDIFGQGTINTFLGYQKSGGTGALGNQFLIMDAGGHCSRPDFFPANSETGLSNNIAFEVFSTVVDGGNVSDLLYDAVNLYVMGPKKQRKVGNFWVCMSDFPETTSKTLFLGDQFNLTEEAPNDDGDVQSTLVYDPKNPVPTLGGPNLLIDCGPYDQRDLEKRSDVLVFTSEPLQEDLAIVGDVSFKLCISSNVTDTDFMIKLTDVYPSGESYNILDGGMRTRWRNGSTGAPQYMDDGTVYLLDIDLLSTAYVFPKGHKLRIDITSSNYPRFSINYNNGVLLADDPFEENPPIAENSVWHSTLFQSQLILPVVQLDELQEFECDIGFSGDNDDDEFPIWAIVVIAVGGAVVLALSVLLVMFLFKKNNQDYTEIS